MKILIISDYFSKYLQGQPINVKKWNEELPFFGDKDAVIIDFSNIDRERLIEIINNINELEKRLRQPAISQDNLIILVVCGSKSVEFKDKQLYDPQDERTSFLIKRNSYDFLKDIIPSYGTRVGFLEPPGNYFDPLPIKYISIIQYLNYIQNYYLFFRYDSDSPDCIHIYPLAKTKQSSNACIAFEHRIGKGIVIFLPGYDINKAEEACFSLIKICHNYFKVREGYDELELNMKVPKQIEDDYIEALLCFLNDLYNASVVMSRRALQTSLMEVGAKGRDLYKQISYLYKKKLLHPKTKELAEAIRKYGNVGAHPRNKDIIQVSEKDAREMLSFLKRYLDDIYKETSI